MKQTVFRARFLAPSHLKMSRVGPKQHCSVMNITAKQFSCFYPKAEWQSNIHYLSAGYWLRASSSQLSTPIALPQSPQDKVLCWPIEQDAYACVCIACTWCCTPGTHISSQINQVDLMAWRPRQVVLKDLLLPSSAFTAIGFDNFCMVCRWGLVGSIILCLVSHSWP